MSQVILRVRAPNGLQRLTIKKDVTITELKNEIFKLTNIPATDQQIRVAEKDGALLTNVGSSKLSSAIKNLEDGLELWVVSAKPQATDLPVIISEDQKKKQEEEARREIQKRQFEEKQKKKEEEEKKLKEEYQKKEEEKKANQMIAENEKPNKKKSGKTDIEAKHISFDEYLDKNKGPPRPHSFRVDYNCKKHEPYPKGMCTNCIPQTAIMKRQPYRHVDYAEFMNVKEMNNFVVRWSQKHYTMQRAGILYGYYAEDPNYPLGVRAIIEAIYEPPQIEDVNSVEILEDPRQTKVDMVAEALGFERIGWIFTTLVQQKGLTSYEVRMISKLQEQHLVVHPTGYKVSKFITVVMRHDGQNVAPDVYMVSDQCQAMERDGVFDDPDNYKELKIRDPVDKHDIVPVVIAENKETKKIDPDFFVVDINHGQPKHNKFNYIKHADFSVENIEGKKQTPADIKSYLSKHSKEKAYIKYADFHFLVYLAEILDVDTACILADAVKNEAETVNESIELLLNSF